MAPAFAAQGFFAVHGPAYTAALPKVSAPVSMAAAIAAGFLTFLRISVTPTKLGCERIALGPTVSGDVKPRATRLEGGGKGNQDAPLSIRRNKQTHESSIRYGGP